jgi:hypothetical protein
MLGYSSCKFPSSDEEEYRLGLKVLWKEVTADDSTYYLIDEHSDKSFLFRDNYSMPYTVSKVDSCNIRSYFFISKESSESLQIIADYEDNVIDLITRPFFLPDSLFHLIRNKWRSNDSDRIINFARIPSYDTTIIWTIYSRNQERFTLRSDTILNGHSFYLDLDRVPVDIDSVGFLMYFQSSQHSYKYGFEYFKKVELATN